MTAFNHAKPFRFREGAMFNEHLKVDSDGCLRYLEFLQIDSEPQLSWYDRFARLRNLKTLYYRMIYPGYDCT